MNNHHQAKQPIRSHRDLTVWQKSMELAQLIYKVTETMPVQEQYGLTSQIRRAAVSVPSNIAEGYGRQSRTEYLRFLKIARGSLAELSTQYELTGLLGLLASNEEVVQLIEEVGRILQGLITRLNQKSNQA